MGLFFIDTDTGRVATQMQLIEAGIATSNDVPPRPWLQIRCTGDATTMWYAVLRKEISGGKFIGSLVFRHSDHHASLLKQGWREIAPEEIGTDDTRRPLAPSPLEQPLGAENPYG
ncbi:MAG TPA: hypothetical protein VNT22_08010 [Baekduia sp.]|nr:hypothetical protein [Baekduia sp.]